jgi:hypothetical protein
MPSKSGSYCSCTVAPLVRAALRQSNRLNEEHDHHHGGCLVAWGALGRSLLEHGLQCIEGCPLIQVVSSCNVFQHTYLPRVKFRDHPCGMAHGTAIIWPVNGLMFKCHACTNQHWKSPFCGNCPRLSFVTRKVGSSTIIFLIVTSIKTKTPKTHQKRAIPYQKLQSFTILQHTLL